MDDAVLAAKQSLGADLNSTTHQAGSMFGGGEMLDEVLSRRFDSQQPAPVAPQAPPPDTTAYKQEIDNLKSQLAGLSKQLEQRSSQDEYLKQMSNGQSQMMQALMQYRPQQTQEQLPAIEVEDAELAAAFNALDARMDKKMQSHLSHMQQQQNAYQQAMAWDRFHSAINRVDSNPLAPNGPKLTDLFTREELQRYAQSQLANPQSAFLNWENELGLIAKAKDYDRLLAERNELERKAKDSEKSVQKERTQQKANMHLVSGNASRAGDSHSVPVGEQILRDASKAGKKLSFKDFGRELLRRRNG